jgi:site-specific recombinase XerD
MNLFDRFLQERTYLKGVSPETLRYYRCVEGAFQPILANPTKDGMLDRIQGLRAKGLSPTSLNTYLRGFKAYIRWLPEEGQLKDVFKIQFLKTESKVLATLNPEQMTWLIRFKPKGINQTRTHTAAVLILDGGFRISEVLGLPFDQCDFDNLVVKVRGKGNKRACARVDPLERARIQMQPRPYRALRRQCVCVRGAYCGVGQRVHDGKP